MGDSKVIVDWAMEAHSIQSVDLFHYIGRVKRLFGHFINLSFLHIYREYNKLAAGISKQDIGLKGGMIAWEEHSEGCLTDSGQMSLFWASFCHSMQ